MATNDEIDLHRLDLRFAPACLIVPGAVAALAGSIEQSGQLVPCITVSEADGAGLILIDGYRRIEALRRLGRDTARIETWTCPLAQGLLTFFARHGQGPLAAIEEGVLLQELVQGQGSRVLKLSRNTVPRILRPAKDADDASSGPVSASARFDAAPPDACANIPLRVSSPFPAPSKKARTWHGVRTSA